MDLSTVKFFNDQIELLKLNELKTLLASLTNTKNRYVKIDPKTLEKLKDPKAGLHIKSDMFAPVPAWRGILEVVKRFFHFETENMFDIKTSMATLQSRIKKIDINDPSWEVSGNVDKVTQQTIFSTNTTKPVPATKDNQPPVLPLVVEKPTSPAKNESKEVEVAKIYHNLGSDKADTLVENMKKHFTLTRLVRDPTIDNVTASLNKSLKEVEEKSQIFPFGLSGDIYFVATGKTFKAEIKDCRLVEVVMVKSIQPGLLEITLKKPTGLTSSDLNSEEIKNFISEMQSSFAKMPVEDNPSLDSIRAAILNAQSEAQLPFRRPPFINGEVEFVSKGSKYRAEFQGGTLVDLELMN
jgi:hypothetical protein